MINLLNKICEKNQQLQWNLVCTYSNTSDRTIMQIKIRNMRMAERLIVLNFCMETSLIIHGFHPDIGIFPRQTLLIDALLDILSLEQVNSPDATG